MRLKGKVALITGGTSGIGSATAIRFATEGAAVAITGRNSERGEQVVQEIEANGGKALFIRSDVCLSKDCRDAVDQTLEHFGKIDILFNNAYFDIRNAPLRLESIVSSHSSSVQSGIFFGWKTPALLNRISILPKCSSV